MLNDSLKSAQEEFFRLKADLEAEKKARELVEAETANDFDAGHLKAKEMYADEVVMFENRGLKHEWLKALAAAKVTR